MTNRTIVIGGGLGGMSAVYELRERLPNTHEVMLINKGDEFHFIPSTPWVAVGERTREQIIVDIPQHVKKYKIPFNNSGAAHIDADKNKVTCGDGSVFDYTHLVICTGPRLAFERVEGLGPDHGYTESICSVHHAEQAYEKFLALQKDPGPVVVGAVQGASCYGPAYEYVMTLDHYLRKAKIRDKVPMYFVTSEPYIGHMGLGGVGDSKGILEHKMRDKGINFLSNCQVKKFTAETVYIEEVDRRGEHYMDHQIDFKFAMFLPPFDGQDVVKNVPNLCNEKGFIITDEQQRSPVYSNIFAAGVCAAVPGLEKTPVPTGVPKTGFMIESMTTCIVENLLAELAGQTSKVYPTYNAVCLADMGNTGAAFVALPQNPPRNHNWAAMGKWVHLAKVGFEKYFIWKVKHGTSEPWYEKYMMGILGIHRIKKSK